MPSVTLHTSFWLVTFVISVSKIGQVNAVDPLNRGNNLKVAVYSCLAFRTQQSMKHLKFLVVKLS